MIKTQIKLSVVTFPLVLTESFRNVRTVWRIGLLLGFVKPLQSTHSGLGLVKINSRNGISMPIEIIENATDKMINRK